MTSRRTFIKKSATTIGGLSLLPSLYAGETKSKKITGLQLYSVRQEMKADPKGTLSQLASMGYVHLEHANYINHTFYGWAAKEFRKILDDLGLKMPSGHTVMRAEHWNNATKDFADSWKRTVDDAAILGQTYVISPSLEAPLRQDEDVLKRFLEVFNKSGELCKKAGMMFGYHNHDFEFREKLNGKTLYEIILTNTDPKLVMQQFDMGNLYNGDADAVEVLQKYPNRFLSLHVKNEIAATTGDEKYESSLLNNGIVPVKKVIDLAAKQGAKHFIIEQESYQGLAPMDCAKKDLQIMKEWGY